MVLSKYEINKLEPIINEDLLKSFRSKRCIICGTKKNVFAHHKITRAKKRLDIEWNLVPLCNYCHTAVHDGRRQFISYLMQNKNVLADSCIAAYEYVTIAILPSQNEVY